MKTFLCPKHRLVLVSSIHQHIACTKKEEIILSSSFLTSVSVLFHTFFIDDKISLSQAQASARQFSTPADSMYQELEIILNDSILSAVAV